MGKVVDMRGQRFGRLLVLDHPPVLKEKSAYWHCVCDCGQEVLARGASMRKGEKLSCGCNGRGLGRIKLDDHEWTKDPTGRFWNCRYRNNVNCEDRKCENCGWNPTVAEERSRRILEKLRSKR